MIITSFYTADYEKHYFKLQESLEKLNLAIWPCYVPDQGSHAENCNLMPKIILEAMRRWPLENVLYLDADSIVLKRPSGIELVDKIFDHDMAFYYWDGRLMAGTGFYKNNNTVKEFLEAWNRRTELYNAIHYSILETDGKPFMQHMLEKWYKPIKVYELSAHYCYFDQVELPREEIYIEHIRVSGK